MAAQLPLPSLHATHAGIWLADGEGGVREATRGEAIAKKGRQVARAALIELLADGEIAVIDDMPAYTYKANKSGVRSLRISRTRTGEEAA